MPTSQTTAARPLVRSSTITFGPFQPSSATIGSNPPCQPSSVIGTSQVGKGATQQEMHQKTGVPSQASRESPSNGNSEDLARTSPSQSIDKGKCHVGGKQKKTFMSKTTRSSRLSWKDNIQFDAKKEVLTVGKQFTLFWLLSNCYFCLASKHPFPGFGLLFSVSHYHN